MCPSEGREHAAGQARLEPHMITYGGYHCTVIHRKDLRNVAALQVQFEGLVQRLNSLLGSLLFDANTDALLAGCLGDEEHVDVVRRQRSEHLR